MSDRRFPLPCDGCVRVLFYFDSMDYVHYDSCFEPGFEAPEVSVSFLVMFQSMFLAISVKK